MTKEVYKLILKKSSQAYIMIDLIQFNEYFVWKYEQVLTQRIRFLFFIDVIGKYLAFLLIGYNFL